VTNSTGTQPGPARKVTATRRTIAWAVLRATASTAALVAIYYLLPLDASSTGVAITILVIGLVVLIVLVTLQVRWILTSPFQASEQSKPSAPASRCSCCYSPAPTW